MITLKSEPVKKNNRVKAVLKLISLIFGLVMVYNLGRGLWEVKVAYRRLDEARSQLQYEEEKKLELEAKLAEVSTKAYVERVARDKLAMQRNGETVLVVEGGEAKEGEREILRSEMPEEPNYLKWWRLIN